MYICIYSYYNYLILEKYYVYTISLIFTFIFLFAIMYIIQLMCIFAEKI